MSGLSSSQINQLAASANQSRPSLKDWVHRLAEQELPAVSSTLGKIQDLAENESCALQALADVILQDAAMTTHVLRLTNSAYHVRNQRSNSVTRALVMLGFKEVRAICLSVAVFSNLSKAGLSQPLTKDLARAFHAAVQAEQVACAMGDRSCQEVFIAALLYDLGRMLFWCYGGEQAEELRTAMEKAEKSPAELEREILGFELWELTEQLALKWGLGELLLNSIRLEEDSSDERIKSVRLSHKLAKAVESGWNSREVESIIQELATLSSISSTLLLPLIKSGAEKARAVANEFQAAQAALEIPSAEPLLEKPKPEEVFLAREADVNYQLNALRNISLKLESKPEVQDIVDLVLDGIYRGLGMDRAVFAILSPNKKYLSGKTGLGYQQADFLPRFKFSLDVEPLNIFQSAIESQHALWVQDPKDVNFSSLINPHTREVIGESPFFLAPVIVSGKAIGFFYADRAISKRELSMELFQTFKQFVIFGNISLEHLKNAAR